MATNGVTPNPVTMATNGITPTSATYDVVGTPKPISPPPACENNRSEAMYANNFVQSRS